MTRDMYSDLDIRLYVDSELVSLSELVNLSNSGLVQLGWGDNRGREGGGKEGEESERSERHVITWSAVGAAQ